MLADRLVPCSEACGLVGILFIIWLVHGGDACNIAMFAIQ